MLGFVSRLFRKTSSLLKFWFKLLIFTHTIRSLSFLNCLLSSVIVSKLSSLLIISSISSIIYSFLLRIVFLCILLIKAVLVSWALLEVAVTVGKVDKYLTVCLVGNCLLNLVSTLPKYL